MRAAALVAIVLGVAGCGQRLPPEKPTAALYRDLERLVTVEATSGWSIDRLEVEGLLPAALDSVCRVDAVDRASLLAWIDTEITRAGGPLEAAWRRAGKRMSKVARLQTLTRVRMVLDHAMTAAPADCPFWIEPEANFAGRQISDDRWQLSFGGGGKGIIVVQDGRTDLNAGGAGRALLGRTFGAHGGLYLGLEMGASASFPKDETGDRSGLVLGFDTVAPLVYRHRLVNTYFEVEAGWLGHVTEEDLQTVDHGVHVGLAFGGRATRTRFLFPGAAFGVSYERTWPDEGPSLNMVKIGFRVAFDWDL